MKSHEDVAVDGKLTIVLNSATCHMLGGIVQCLLRNSNIVGSILSSDQNVVFDFIQSLEYTCSGYLESNRNIVTQFSQALFFRICSA